MRILGVVPARGGSVRIPRKNLQSVGGMTLVERAMQHACKMLDRVVLSTDIPELIRAWADDERSEYEFPFEPRGHRLMLRERPPNLAGADVPMAPVLLDALEWAEDPEREWAAYDAGRTRLQFPPLRELFGAVCCIQPTSPLRQTEHISACIRLMLEYRPESVVSVTATDRGWERNGAVYIVRSDILEQGRVWTSGGMYYEMAPEHSLDINTPADLEEARRILG